MQKNFENYNFIEFWPIMMEGCKEDNFDFGVERALISFVYDDKGFGSKLCLWLPVPVVTS